MTQVRSFGFPKEGSDASKRTTIRPRSRRGRSPITGTKQAHRRQIEPDWASIRRELKHKHGTLSILRDEDVKRKPQGLALLHSRFCELHRIW
jgi:hypothetical protein